MPQGARVATVDAGESAPELPAESPPKMSPDGNANPYDHSENFGNMHIAQTRLSIATASREIKEITAEVAEWVERQRVSVGLLTLYIPHTSASLLIQENGSPGVRRDLGAFLHRIVPENIALYRHNDEGPDDMPADIKSALTQTQLSIPVTDGRLQLGGNVDAARRVVPWRRAHAPMAREETARHRGCELRCCA